MIIWIVSFFFVFFGGIVSKDLKQFKGKIGGESVYMIETIGNNFIEQLIEDRKIDAFVEKLKKKQKRLLGLEDEPAPTKIDDFNVADLWKKNRNGKKGVVKGCFFTKNCIFIKKNTLRVGNMNPASGLHSRDVISTIGPKAYELSKKLSNGLVVPEGCDVPLECREQDRGSKKCPRWFWDKKCSKKNKEFLKYVNNYPYMKKKCKFCICCKKSECKKGEKRYCAKPLLRYLSFSIPVCPNCICRKRDEPIKCPKKWRNKSKCKSGQSIHCRRKIFMKYKKCKYCYCCKKNRKCGKWYERKCKTVKKNGDACIVCKCTKKNLCPAKKNKKKCGKGRKRVCRDGVGIDGKTPCVFCSCCKKYKCSKPSKSYYYKKVCKKKKNRKGCKVCRCKRIRKKKHAA